MDERTLRLAIGLLGAVACLCVAGIAFVEASGHPAPQILCTFTGTCLGALAVLIERNAPPARDRRGTDSSPNSHVKE